MQNAANGVMFGKKEVDNPGMFAWGSLLIGQQKHMEGLNDFLKNIPRIEERLSTVVVRLLWVHQVGANKVLRQNAPDVQFNEDGSVAERVQSQPEEVPPVIRMNALLTLHSNVVANVDAIHENLDSYQSDSQEGTWLERKMCFVLTTLLTGQAQLQAILTLEPPPPARK